MSEKYPCYNCPYRKLTCHDYCEEYLAVRESLREEKQKSRALAEAMEVIIGNVRKAKKRRHTR